jgi:hypothetical protein
METSVEAVFKEGFRAGFWIANACSQPPEPLFTPCMSRLSAPLWATPVQRQYWSSTVLIE